MTMKIEKEKLNSVDYEKMQKIYIILVIQIIK